MSATALSKTALDNMKEKFIPITCCWIGVAVVCTCLLSMAHAQQATAAIHRNIAALTDEAATVIHGKVISATVEPDPGFANITTVLVTMSVQDVLKGSAEKTFTFRQVVWDFRERSNAAGYAKGQEMLLFLRPPSRYGLTSPAGLQQGRFIVQRVAAGRAMAINGAGNQGLLDNLEQGARVRGVVLPAVSEKLKLKSGNPLDLDGLKQIVRAFARAGQ